jgi:hypothetical protein
MASIPQPPDPSRSNEQARADASIDAERLAQAAKAEAQSLWNQTRDSARSTLQRRQHDAAAGIGDLAGALRGSAHTLGSEHKDGVALIVERAADSLESISDTLRSKDLDSLLRDAESFARRQPALFLGASVAAGFLALRFLKSTQRADPRRDSPPDTPHAPSPDAIRGRGGYDSDNLH